MVRHLALCISVLSLHHPSNTSFSFLLSIFIPPLSPPPPPPSLFSLIPSLSCSPLPPQQWRDTDAPNRNPHNRRAWYQHQHQHRPHSAGASKSSLEHRLEHDSFESTTSMPNPLLEDEAERLLEKRRRFAQISEPDHTFDKHMGHGEQTVRKQNQRLSRRASDNTPDKAHTALFRMRSRSLSDPDEDFVEARERHGEVCLRESVASGSRRVRRRKSSPTRDKTTGGCGGPMSDCMAFWIE